MGIGDRLSVLYNGRHSDLQDKTEPLLPVVRVAFRGVEGPCDARHSIRDLRRLH